MTRVPQQPRDRPDAPALPDARTYPGWPAERERHYRRQGYWRGETLSEMLSERAAEHGERTAIVSGETRLSYRELAARVDRLAAGLHGLGIRHGDHVVVQLPNIAELIETYFALMRIGAIPVLALPAHRRTEIRQFCRLTEAVAYIVPDRHFGFDHRALAAEVADECPALQHVIVVGSPRDADEPGDSAGAARFRAFDSLHTEPAALPAPPRSTDIALLQLSGGSTGVPKLIPRRHDDYLCAARASLDACPMSPDSVFLGALPVAHNFPLVSPGVLGALDCGATVVLAVAPSPDVVFTLIESECVTITSAVPPLALNWLDAAATTDRDLSSLEVVQIGGAACSPELARRIRPELGATVQQVFGMAEGLINYTRLDDPEDVLVHTQGRPCCDGDEVRIVDDTDRDVAPGTPGHLLTRGPYTIRGYFRPPGDGDGPGPDTAAFTADGFYRTGDLARMREDGNLVVVGRAKEQINRGGEKISPEEVENLLLAHPRVHDAAVVAVADKGLGERTCAFVIPHVDGSSSTERSRAAVAPLGRKDVRSFLRREGLAAYKVPDLVEVVERFPAIGVGKTGRSELRRALTQSLQDAATNDDEKRKARSEA